MSSTSWPVNDFSTNVISLGIENSSSAVALARGYAEPGACDDRLRLDCADEASSPLPNGIDSRAAATIVTFRDPGDFVACRRAERMLEACGFSVGYAQRGEPRGILYGAYDIQKWRNLSSSERDALDGRMVGAMREGPVMVELFDTAPADARNAFCVRAATEVA